jgi:hypothetical protein
MPSVRGPVVKTTISMAETLHKWLKIYGVQHDLSLQDVFDEALLTWAKAHGYAEEDERDENASRARTGS